VVFINDTKVTDPRREVTSADLLHDSLVVLRVGRKQTYVIKRQ
jgi:hypothetical protein